MTPEMMVQLIIGSMVAALGYFAKRALTRFEEKLDGLVESKGQTDVAVAKLEVRVNHLEGLREHA